MTPRSLPRNASRVCKILPERKCSKLIHIILERIEECHLAAIQAQRRNLAFDLVRLQVIPIRYGIDYEARVITNRESLCKLWENKQDGVRPN